MSVTRFGMQPAACHANNTSGLARCHGRRNTGGRVRIELRRPAS